MPKTKSVAKKCETKYCRNKVQGRKYCSKCRMRKMKAENPHQYYYNKQKWRAKERGIRFTLTLQEYIDFCNEHDFLNKKGKTAGCLNMDRINNDPAIGYTKDNIQPMEKIANIRKYFDYDRMQVVVEKIPIEDRIESGKAFIQSIVESDEDYF